MLKPESSPRPAGGKALLVWNVMALAVLAMLWVYASRIASINAPLRFAFLDRAGVVDEGKLREALPDLADNPRHDVGMWIAEKERNAASLLAETGIIIVFVNLALALVSRRRSRLVSTETSSSTESSVG